MRSRAAAAGFAALIAAVGGWVGLQAVGIAETGGYSPVGPRFFPMLVAVALVVIGLALLLRALRGDEQAADSPAVLDPPALAQSSVAADAGGARQSTTPAGDPAAAAAAVHAPYRAALVWLSAAMLSGAMLIARAGFVIAMAVAFWLASRAFTARVTDTLLRDAVIAVLVAVAVQFFFSKVLGLRLPAGPLGF